jgi:hypothetical protein
MLDDLGYAIRHLRGAPGLALAAVVSLALGIGALGAARRDLVSLALGLLLAVGLSRLLQSQLSGVAAGDPVTFVVTPLVRPGVAALAVLVPARRATRVDPLVALRAE